MSLVNKLFKKTAAASKKKSVPAEILKKSPAATSEAKTEPVKKPEIKSTILLAPHTAEKALMNQSIGKYVFKVAPSANKIEIAREVNKIYGVKAVDVNIVNTKGKERRVGGKIGFKSGYKKAIITLAQGQTIEIK